MLVKAFADDYNLKFKPHQVEGPASPRDYLDWNARLRKHRLEQQNKKETHITSGHDVPELEWVQTSYVQPHVMANDLFLFDPKTNKYTVDKYVQGLYSVSYAVLAVLFTWHNNRCNRTFWYYRFHRRKWSLKTIEILHNYLCLLCSIDLA